MSIARMISLTRLLSSLVAASRYDRNRGARSPRYGAQRAPSARPTAKTSGRRARRATCHSYRHQHRAVGPRDGASSPGACARDGFHTTVTHRVRSIARCSESRSRACASSARACCRIAKTSSHTNFSRPTLCPTPTTTSPQSPPHAWLTNVSARPTTPPSSGRSTKRHGARRGERGPTSASAAAAVSGLITCSTTHHVGWRARPNASVNATIQPSATPRCSMSTVGLRSSAGTAGSAFAVAMRRSSVAGGKGSPLSGDQSRGIGTPRGSLLLPHEPMP